jgi:neurotransmitter:Na+ symporter, NSS family
MIVAMLGMAVGTGNIWRFPRVAATNGGGSFLVAWFVFLLLWSMPLILIEFAMGKATRSGTCRRVRPDHGPRYAWMGAWVAWTATPSCSTTRSSRAGPSAIPGRPSAANCARTEPGALWEGFAYSWASSLFQALALGSASSSSRAACAASSTPRVADPSLFVLVVVLAIRAVTLPGAWAG